MDPHSMEKAMLKNMVQKTGKPIEEWINLINKQNFVDNKNIVIFLKEEYSVGHFYAYLIVKNLKKY